jgi:cytochrome b561
MMRNIFKKINILSARKQLSTSSTSEAPSSYAGMVQFMHWTMGSTVAGCVATVLLAQNTTDKAEKGKLMFIHKSCGVTAALLLGPRIAVRLMSRSPGPLAGNHAIENILGSISHFVLYGLITVLPVTGVLMGYYGGNGLPFWYTTIPGAEKGKTDPSIAKPAFQYHKLAGQALEYIVPLHIGATAVHAFRGQKILSRILPIGK